MNLTGQPLLDGAFMVFALLGCALLSVANIALSSPPAALTATEPTRGDRAPIFTGRDLWGH